jgi:molybdopterin-guanine dinucleotide biosynthesis protein A
MQVAGFVLVGGRSLRMGRDKAKLPLNSNLLVEDVTAKIRVVAESVALVGASQRYHDLPFECLDDLRPGLGPLAGVQTALASGRGELNLIVACDMPNIQVEWLQNLVAKAIELDSDCVVCKDSRGSIHPLCGVWKQTCLPRVSSALARRRLRLRDLVEELNAVYLPVGELIHNVNTPDEWETWCNQSNNIILPT